VNFRNDSTIDIVIGIINCYCYYYIKCPSYSSFDRATPNLWLHVVSSDHLSSIFNGTTTMARMDGKPLPNYQRSKSAS